MEPSDCESDPFFSAASGSRLLGVLESDCTGAGAGGLAAPAPLARARLGATTGIAMLRSGRWFFARRETAPCGVAASVEIRKHASVHVCRLASCAPQTSNY